jgi:hypothetical protein
MPLYQLHKSLFYILETCRSAHCLLKGCLVNMAAKSPPKRLPVDFQRTGAPRDERRSLRGPSCLETLVPSAQPSRFERSAMRLALLQAVTRMRHMPLRHCAGTGKDP